MASPKSEKSMEMLSLGCRPFGEDTSLNAIVLIHGINDSKEIWGENTVRDIAHATKRRTYAVDLRCHGSSVPYSPDALTTELIFKDLNYFLQKKNISKAILGGNLLGGTIACLFALKYPDKVEMLINVDGPVFLDKIQDSLRHMLDFMRIWETAVKQVSKAEAPTKEDAVKLAVKYVFNSFDHTDFLEKKRVLEKQTFPLVTMAGNAGYMVSQMTTTIYSYMERVIAGEEFEIPSNCSYTGPCLFMMSNLSDFRKGMDHPDVKKLFPDIKWKKFKYKHFLIAEPELFKRKVLSFIKKKSS